jgi:hypothetical protein
MKPDYRITLTITALLIVAALIIPPWKDTFNGQFAGFYYVFSEKEVPTINSGFEIDYGRLAIEVICIILIMVSIHSFMLVPFVNAFLVKVQAFIGMILKPIILAFRFLDRNIFLIKIFLLAIAAVAFALGFK